MFTDKQLRALFGIITFIFLCFLGIKKNPYFIQSILIFASFGLIIIINIFVILCNSHIPSELQSNPKYKCGNTTGWVKLTRDLQQYMHRLLKLISVALVVLFSQVVIKKRSLYLLFLSTWSISFLFHWILYFGTQILLFGIPF